MPDTRYVKARKNGDGVTRWYWIRPGHKPRRLSDAEDIRLREADDWNKWADQRPDGRAPVYPKKRPHGGQGFYAGLLNSARGGAKLRNLKYTLTEADLERLIERAGGKCEVTRIPFNYQRTGQNRRPWAPSIDRIDSQRGYTPDNVRLVCFAVNIALSDMGDSVLEAICHSYCKAQGWEPPHGLVANEHLSRAHRR